VKAAVAGAAFGVAAVLGFAAFCGSPPASPLVGQPMPALAVRDASGRATTLEAWPGRVSVVNVWASWCGPCLEEMPSLSALHAELGDEGLQLVGVAVDDDPADARLAARKLGIAYPLVFDPGGATTFDRLAVEGIPTTFVVGRDGRIEEVLTGIADYGTPEALDHFRGRLRR
jgi:thiol-disulfide isomerase/thioredoxin